VTAWDISAGVIFCPDLFSDVAVTVGVVLLDAMLDAIDLVSFILVGFATFEFTAVVVVLFPTAATLLDGIVTLLFAVGLPEAVDFVGADATADVFRVWGVVTGAGVTATCLASVGVVVTACVVGLLGVD
jgi:hypothetical protein